MYVYLCTIRMPLKAEVCILTDKVIEARMCVLTLRQMLEKDFLHTFGLPLGAIYTYNMLH